MAAPDGKLVREALKEYNATNTPEAIVRSISTAITLSMCDFSFRRVNTHYMFKFSGFSSCEAMMASGCTYSDLLPVHDPQPISVLLTCIYWPLKATVHLFLTTCRFITPSFCSARSAAGSQRVQPTGLKGNMTVILLSYNWEEWNKREREKENFKWWIITHQQNCLCMCVRVCYLVLATTF